MLVSSESNITYSVSDEATVRQVAVNPVTGEAYRDNEVGAANGYMNPSVNKKIDLLKDLGNPGGENGVVNAARPRFGKPEGRKYYPSYLIPSESNVDGSVTISGNVIFYDRGGTKTRGNAAFHELSENYYRVSGQTYQNAHNSAISAENKFRSGDSRKSNTPGMITNVKKTN
jgi:hypothetical protein